MTVSYFLLYRTKRVGVNHEKESESRKPRQKKMMIHEERLESFPSFICLFTRPLASAISSLLEFKSRKCPFSQTRKVAIMTLI